MDVKLLSEGITIEEINLIYSPPAIPPTMAYRSLFHLNPLYNFIHIININLLSVKLPYIKINRGIFNIKWNFLKKSSLISLIWRLV